MRLLASLVPIKNITCLTPSNFNDGELKKLAEQILKVEGIISPLIVRKTGVESYELIDGYFEYYASVKARDIDPRKGTMVSVFIAEPENATTTSAIEEQVELLRKSRSASVTPPIDTDTAGKTAEEIVSTMMLESKSQSLQEFQDIKRYLIKLESEFTTIKFKLDEINSRLPPLPPPRLPPNRILEKLNEIDESDLRAKLKSATLSKDIIEKIVKARTNNGQFSTFDDLGKHASLSKGTIKKIIDFTGWN